MKLEIPFLKKIKIPLLQIALGASAIVCLVLTIPQVLNMQKVSREVSEKKKILQDLDRGIKNFELLEKENKSLEKAYDDFMASIPPQKEFSVFLERISDMARENHVKIIAIEPQKPLGEMGLFFVRIPVLVDAYCGYHDLGRFLNDIEYSNKFMKIDNIKISSDDFGADMLQVFLSIHTFCLRDFSDE